MTGKGYSPFAGQQGRGKDSQWRIAAHAVARGGKEQGLGSVPIMEGLTEKKSPNGWGKASSI